MGCCEVETLLYFLPLPDGRNLGRMRRSAAGLSAFADRRDARQPEPAVHRSRCSAGNFAFAVFAGPIKPCGIGPDVAHGFLREHQKMPAEGAWNARRVDGKDFHWPPSSWNQRGTNLSDSGAVWRGMGL